MYDRSVFTTSSIEGRTGTRFFEACIKCRTLSPVDEFLARTAAELRTVTGTTVQLQYRLA